METHMKGMKIAVFLIIFMLYFIIPNKHSLHMFQQNRYELRRYTQWIKSNSFITVHCYIDLLFLILISEIIAFTDGYLSLIFLLIFGGLFLSHQITLEKSKIYIKKLVYTSRLIRQMVILFFLEGTLVSLALHWLKPSQYLLMVLFYPLPWILIYLVSLVTEPIEYMIRNWYLNDAKRILSAHSNLLKIGITGSYGKTSTKHIIQAVLSEKFNTLMTPASFNTPMGVTRTIREYLKPIHEIFVCEMGADKVGDICELMNFVHPSVGVVTSIGAQHLATFKTQENIINEKMQMVEQLPQNGLAVLNYDNSLIREYRIQNKVKIISYGIENCEVDYFATNISYGKKGTKFTLLYQNEMITFESELLGKHNILNILSAIAVGHYFGITWHEIQRAIKMMKQVEHRLEQKCINGYHFIDDAFNANPVGTAMALDVLSQMPNRRVIVTPGMIDLGEKQYEINCEFGRQMKDKVDLVLLVGEKQTKAIVDGLKEVGFDMEQVKIYAKVQEAFSYIYQNLTSEDTILLENDLPDAFNY